MVVAEQLDTNAGRRRGASADRRNGGGGRVAGGSRVEASGGSIDPAGVRPGARGEDLEPTVVVDDLHITYRVFGATTTPNNAPAAGLLPATQGAVYTDGQPTLLGVNAALMNDLTGERNIILGCLAMGLTPTEAKARYDDIVEFSGLEDFIDLPMRTYSSGMSHTIKMDDDAETVIHAYHTATSR